MNINGSLLVKMYPIFQKTPPTFYTSWTRTSVIDNACQCATASFSWCFLFFFLSRLGFSGDDTLVVSGSTIEIVWSFAGTSEISSGSSCPKATLAFIRSFFPFLLRFLSSFKYQRVSATRFRLSMSTIIESESSRFHTGTTQCSTPCQCSESTLPLSIMPQKVQVLTEITPALTRPVLGLTFNRRSSFNSADLWKIPIAHTLLG